MSDQPTSSADAYEEWSYHDLRETTFERARQLNDIRFFVRLLSHTPAMTATADEGGSLGEISGSLIEVFEAAKQMFSDEPDDLGPMFRAVFATYLREHGLPAAH